MIHLNLGLRNVSGVLRGEMWFYLITVETYVYERPPSTLKQVSIETLSKFITLVHPDNFEGYLHFKNSQASH